MMSWCRARGGVQPMHLASKLGTQIRRQRPSPPKQGKTVMTKKDQPDKAAAVQGDEREREDKIVAVCVVIQQFIRAAKDGVEL